MAETQGVSFIPQQPVQGKPKQKKVRRVYMLTYISMVVFFAALVASAFVFFYKMSAENKLEAEKLQLIEERKRFDQSEIERLRALDTRLEEAENLIGQHAAVSQVLDALETALTKEVQLTTVAMERAGDRIAVELEAVAPDFAAIEFQRSIVENSPLLKNAVMTDFTFTAESQEGDPAEVGHTIAFSVSVADVAYAGEISEESSPAEFGGDITTIELDDEGSDAAALESTESLEVDVVNTDI